MKDKIKNPVITADWKEQIIPVREDRKCSHFFEFVGGQACCSHCPLRLIGVLEIKDGKPVL